MNQALTSQQRPDGTTPGGGGFKNTSWHVCPLPGVRLVEIVLKGHGVVELSLVGTARGAGGRQSPYMYALGSTQCLTSLSKQVTALHSLWRVTLERSAMQAMLRGELLLPGLQGSCSSTDWQGPSATAQPMLPPMLLSHVPHLLPLVDPSLVLSVSDLFRRELLKCLFSYCSVNCNYLEVHVTGTSYTSFKHKKTKVQSQTCPGYHTAGDMQALGRLSLP